MFYSLFCSSVIGALQIAVPSYALRLTRLFGTRRVGWWVVIAFSLMAALYLLHPFQVAGLDFTSPLLLLYAVVPLLLLVGLGHVETLTRTRLGAEHEQRALIRKLQAELTERTAALTEDAQELREELARRTKAEDLLKQSQAQYRALFMENPQPMWIFDLRSLRLLTANNAALRQYGYTRDEFMALNPGKLVFAAEMAAFNADLQKPCYGPQARGLWHHARKDGALIEVEVTALDLMYAGYPSRLVLVQDVTERRQAEARTLQPQKLEVMSDLAGRVADHFQAMMLVLEGYAQLLKQKNPEPALAEQLKRITSTVDRASESTRQLLAVARRHPLKTQLLDLNRFIDQLTRKFAPSLSQDIRVDRIYAPDLPPVSADPVVLEQILLALFANARDAMSHGGALTVSTKRMHIDEDYVRFQEDARVGVFVCVTICDTGTGMTPNSRAHLFEPFFTTKDPAQSAGLNLAGAYGLIKQHHGWIELSTEVGIGTAIRIYLPCNIAA